MTLTDSSGNTGSIDLTDRITARVCEESSSSTYTTVARCAGYWVTTASEHYPTVTVVRTPSMVFTTTLQTCLVKPS